MTCVTLTTMTTIIPLNALQKRGIFAVMLRAKDILGGGRSKQYEQSAYTTTSA